MNKFKASILKAYEWFLGLFRKKKPPVPTVAEQANVFTVRFPSEVTDPVALEKISDFHKKCTAMNIRIENYVYDQSRLHFLVHSVQNGTHSPNTWLGERALPTFNVSPAIGIRKEK